jgi:hypothetical protein
MTICRKITSSGEQDPLIHAAYLRSGRDRRPPRKAPPVDRANGRRDNFHPMVQRNRPDGLLDHSPGDACIRPGRRGRSLRTGPYQPPETSPTRRFVICPLILHPTVTAPWRSPTSPTAEAGGRGCLCGLFLGFTSSIVNVSAIPRAGASPTTVLGGCNPSAEPTSSYHHPHHKSWTSPALVQRPDLQQSRLRLSVDKSLVRPQEMITRDSWFHSETFVGSADATVGTTPSGSPEKYSPGPTRGHQVPGIHEALISPDMKLGLFQLSSNNLSEDIAQRHFLRSHSQNKCRGFF